jgi:hypothetical protein
MTARVWPMVAALTMGLAVLMASPAMAVVGLSVAGVSAGLWLTGFSRPTDGRPRHRDSLMIPLPNVASSTSLRSSTASP